MNGNDINHVLMFNGLCLEFRFSGDIRMRPTHQSDALLNVFRSKEAGKPADVPTEEVGADMDIPDVLQRQMGFPKTAPPKRNITTLLTEYARLQHHELMQEMACVVEIEPNLAREEEYIARCAEK